MRYLTCTSLFPFKWFKTFYLKSPLFKWVFFAVCGSMFFSPSSPKLVMPLGFLFSASFILVASCFCFFLIEYLSYQVFSPSYFSFQLPSKRYLLLSTWNIHVYVVNRTFFVSLFVCLFVFQSIFFFFLSCFPINGSTAVLVLNEKKCSFYHQFSTVDMSCNTQSQYESEKSKNPHWLYMDTYLLLYHFEIF